MPLTCFLENDNGEESHKKKSASVWMLLRNCKKISQLDCSVESRWKVQLKAQVDCRIQNLESTACSRKGCVVFCFVLAINIWKGSFAFMPGP